MYARDEDIWILCLNTPAEAEDVLEGRQKKQQQPQDLLPHSAHKTVGMFGRKSELVNAIADHCT